MDWLVFGDDWGRHPSTTQHLIRHLPTEDRVTWVDSVGMRPPRLTLSDLGRIRGRLRPVARDVRLHAHIRPRLLPWHEHPLAQRVNRYALRDLPDADVTLVTNPLAALYVENPKYLVYLRLDDWPNFPGVDARYVALAEPALLERADLIVAPNAYLLAGLGGKTLLLSQGVDVAHFARVPLAPPATKVVGFWGGLSAWLDQALIEAAAARHPDWTFELIGRREVALQLRAPNIHVRAAVPFDDLPDVTAHWRAAWLPYVTGSATRGMSPLKLREYLAAGFPTASTALPEAATLPHVQVIDLDRLDPWLATLGDDTAEARALRRQSVAPTSWSTRAATLRQATQGVPKDS